jgi:hypothetical protein
MTRAPYVKPSTFWAVINPKGMGIDAIVAILPGDDKEALAAYTELAMLQQSTVSDERHRPDKWIFVPFIWKGRASVTAIPRCVENWEVRPYTSEHIWNAGLRGEPMGNCTKCGRPFHEWSDELLRRSQAEPANAFSAHGPTPAGGNS